MFFYPNDSGQVLTYTLIHSIFGNKFHFDLSATLKACGESA
jgi:hypothetical protein